MNLSLTELPLPLRLRTATPMTDDELLRFCEGNEVLRIEREPTGDLIVMSPTGMDTGGRNLDIGTDLNLWARQDGRGRAFDSNTRFTLPDNSMRSPDAAWILTSRLECLTAEQRRRFAPICPDFVIELRSPSDSLPALQSKMESWIANGVQLAWLIDPEIQQVTVYRPNEAPELHQSPTTIHGTGVMAGFEFIMDRTWA